MAEAKTIMVSVTGRGVRAEENPLGANPGDTVTWFFGESTASTVGKNLHVVFREVELADGSGKTEPCGPNGPFSELSRNPEQIVGTISPTAQKGRYLYDVFLKLDWINPLPPDGNFGGVDVPPPPPRGG
jgi:hypothetical protein